MNLPVDHIEPMQMLQRDQQLRGIEPTPLLVELPFPLQMMEQLSTVYEREDEVEFLLGLERELERDDEGVVNLSEDGSFGEGVDDFGSGDDVCFSDGLESVDSGGISFTDLHDLDKRRGKAREGSVEGRKNERKGGRRGGRADLSEGSLSDNLEKLEGIDGERDVLDGTTKNESASGSKL